MQGHNESVKPEGAVQPEAQGEPKFTLTTAELALDIPQLLANNDAAIECLRKAGIPVPDEAFEMQTVLRRCVHAESVKAELLSATGKAVEILVRRRGMVGGPEEQCPCAAIDTLKAAIAKAGGAA